MYDIKLFLLIAVHKVKLAQLINENASYEEILKESQILDEYIVAQMKRDSR